VRKMARKYVVYGSPEIDVGIKIIDLATPFMKFLARSFPRYFDRALKSAGWWLQKEIKAGIRSGAPGGVPYATYSGLMSRRRSGRLYRGFPKVPMGRLSRAVGYQFLPNKREVVVGWLSKSAVRLGTKHEEGFQREVTPKMRKYFESYGFPIGASKTHITLPRRRTYGPIYREKGPEVPKYIEGKIWQYIKEAKEKGGRSA